MSGMLYLSRMPTGPGRGGQPKEDAVDNHHKTSDNGRSASVKSDGENSGEHSNQGRPKLCLSVPVSISLSIFVSLSFSFSLSLLIFLSLFLSLSLSPSLSFSFSLSISLFVSISVCLSVSNFLSLS